MRKIIVILCSLSIGMGFRFVLYGTGDTNHQERTIEEIVVLWLESDDHLQFSGMDWYNDYLIMLPEYKFYKFRPAPFFTRLKLASP